MNTEVYKIIIKGCSRIYTLKEYEMKDSVMIAHETKYVETGNSIMHVYCNLGVECSKNLSHFIIHFTLPLYVISKSK